MRLSARASSDHVLGVWLRESLWGQERWWGPVIRISGLLGSCLWVGTAATSPAEWPIKPLGILARPNYPALESPAAHKVLKLHRPSLRWP